MANDLTELAGWLEPIINRLSDRERTRLMRHLATALRRRNQQRIRDQVNPDGSPFAPRKHTLRNQRGRVRRAPMFRRLRQARYMRVAGNSDMASVSILGRAGRIAAVHQYGLRDRVSPDGPQHDYESRRLLGFAESDQHFVLDTVLSYLDSGVV